MTTQKNPEIIRYFRFCHTNGEIRGNGGAAVLFVIRQDENMLEMYPAICSMSDTFDKERAWGMVNYRQRHGIGLIAEYRRSLTLSENFIYLLDEWKEKDFTSFKYICPKQFESELNNVLKQCFELPKQCLKMNVLEDLRNGN